MLSLFRRLFPPPEVGRSGKWPRVRAEHLASHPACWACGKRGSGLEVHHIVPVSVDPSRELDPSNCLTLCADPCHLVHGHLMNFRRHDPDVVVNCRNFRERLDTARKSCGH